MGTLHQRITFEGCNFINLVSFEWNSQNKVGNNGILVLWKVCEKKTNNSYRLAIRFDIKFNLLIFIYIVRLFFQFYFWALFGYTHLQGYVYIEKKTKTKPKLTSLSDGFIGVVTKIKKLHSRSFLFSVNEPYQLHMI